MPNTLVVTTDDHTAATTDAGLTYTISKLSFVLTELTIVLLVHCVRMYTACWQNIWDLACDRYK